MQSMYQLNNNNIATPFDQKLSSDHPAHDVINMAAQKTVFKLIIRL